MAHVWPSTREGPADRLVELAAEQRVDEDGVGQLDPGECRGHPAAQPGRERAGLRLRRGGRGERVERAVRASSCRSSTASSRWTSAPKARPAVGEGAALPGRPATTAVCANSDATASPAGASSASSPCSGRRSARAASLRRAQDGPRVQPDLGGDRAAAEREPTGEPAGAGAGAVRQVAGPRACPGARRRR